MGRQKDRQNYLNDQQTVRQVSAQRNEEIAVMEGRLRGGRSREGFIIQRNRPQSSDRWRAAIGDVMDSTLTTRRVELLVLADEEMSRSHGGDKVRVNQKIASIVALMNSLYKPLNIEFLIKHITVKEKDMRKREEGRGKIGCFDVALLVGVSAEWSC